LLLFAHNGWRIKEVTEGNLGEA